MEQNDSEKPFIHEYSDKDDGGAYVPYKMTGPGVDYGIIDEAQELVFDNVPQRRWPPLSDKELKGIDWSKIKKVLDQSITGADSVSYHMCALSGHYHHIPTTFRTCYEHGAWIMQTR